MNSPDPRTELRRRLGASRAALDAATRIRAAEGVADALEQLPLLHASQRVAGYWAVGGELSLHAAVARLLRRGQTYCLPLIQPARQLTFAAWQPGAALLSNRHGIPEPDAASDAQLAPQDLNLVLLPLLGFDRRGYRLGSGGGFYDRSFAFLNVTPRPSQPILVGIGYSLQELPEIQAQPWDVRLDYVATEHELIRCA